MTAKKLTQIQAENMLLDVHNGHDSVIAHEVLESLESQQNIADFKSWLHTKIDAIRYELVAVSVSEPGSIRHVSLNEQWRKYRNADSVHKEFQEALNAQSTR